MDGNFRVWATTFDHAMLCRNLKNPIIETVVHARIDEETKKVAADVLGARGLSIPAAFSLMLRRITTDRDLPFDPLMPDDETIKAMEAARRGELVHVGSVDELMADLDADD